MPALLVQINPQPEALVGRSKTSACTKLSLLTIKIVEEPDMLIRLNEDVPGR
jgi:hypothetical protein